MLLTTKMARKTSMRFVRNRKKIQKALPVMIVKQKRRRHGPKITNLLQAKKVVKMRYAIEVGLDPTVTTPASFAFSCNNINSPLASVAHQPLTHDQWALFYNKYRVLSSKIKVTNYVTSISNLAPAWTGTYIDPDGTLTYTTAEQIIEDPRTGKQFSSTFQKPDQRSGNTVFRKSFNPKRHLAPEAAGDSTAFGSDPPADVTFFYVLWAAAMGTLASKNEPGLMHYLVEIDYVVELTEPVVLGQS